MQGAAASLRCRRWADSTACTLAIEVECRRAAEFKQQGVRSHCSVGPFWEHVQHLGQRRWSSALHSCFPELIGWGLLCLLCLLAAAWPASGSWMYIREVALLRVCCCPCFLFHAGLWVLSLARNCPLQCHAGWRGLADWRLPQFHVSMIGRFAEAIRCQIALLIVLNVDCAVVLPSWAEVLATSLWIFAGGYCDVGRVSSRSWTRNFGEDWRCVW